MKLLQTLQKGWSSYDRSNIRLRPSEAQKKALADDKAMREAAELLNASRIALRRLLSDDRTFGDNEAALLVLKRLEDA